LWPKYQLGASRASADWSPNPGGQIIGGDMVTSNQSRWFSTSGDAWKLSSSGWERGDWEMRVDLPVPPTDVIFLVGESTAIGFGMHLITNDDVAWTIFTVGSSDGQWQEVDPFPGGPVSLERVSWGAVKARSR
jgi:hypothetical protein